LPHQGGSEGQITGRSPPWYAGVTRYQWLVLAVASAGWVFDAFEGQLFNITRGQMLDELLGPGNGEGKKLWGDRLLAVFLVVGVLPACLVLWVRVSVKEPERWERTGTQGRPRGSFRELCGSAVWGRRAVLGRLLASVGLGTFWGVTVAGQDLTRELFEREGVP